MAPLIPNTPDPGLCDCVIVELLATTQVIVPWNTSNGYPNSGFSHGLEPFWPIPISVLIVSNSVIPRNPTGLMLGLMTRKGWKSVALRPLSARATVSRKRANVWRPHSSIGVCVAVRSSSTSGPLAPNIVQSIPTYRQPRQRDKREGRTKCAGAGIKLVQLSTHEDLQNHQHISTHPHDTVTHKGIILAPRRRRRIGVDRHTSRILGFIRPDVIRKDHGDAQPPNHEQYAE